MADQMREPDYQAAEEANPYLDKSKPYPLEGILVVDLTHVLSGPTSTRMLADAGARVIHVERSGSGDDTRSMGPYLSDGSSEYFRIANAGKESIALDFKDPDDFALLKRIIAKADVVVENFRPGVMARLGIAPDDLVAENPQLIVASVSGFGQYGPMSKQAAYDTIVQALSGIMDATGAEDGPATRVGTSISDIVAGIMAYGAITTALVARERTGKGTTIDVSMLDATFSLLAQELMSTLGPHEVPHKIGNRHPYIYPFDTFECADQPLAVCCGNDHLWGQLCDALGHSEWTGDSNFATNDLREQNWKLVKESLESVLKTDEAAHWEKLLQEAGIPVGVVLNVDQTRRLPQIIARGMVKALPDGREVIGTPLKYGTWNSWGAKTDSPDLDADGNRIRAEFAE